MSTALPRDAGLDALVNKWLHHKTSAERHADEAKRLQAEILVRVGPGRRYEMDDGVGVTVSKPVERITEAKAREVLTELQLAACYEHRPVFSVDRMRAVHPGALVAQCVVVGSPTVRAL